MSWNFDDIQVGGQLRVGTGIVAAIKEGDTKINGSMHAEGPVVLVVLLSFQIILPL